jgi:iron complex transport system substrate-binding protein
MRAIVAVLLLALVACTERGARTGTRAPLRVVSLHDVTTELVVALGSTSRLVGVGEPVDVSPDVQAQIRDVTRVGGLESIRAVEPDVVLGLGVVADRDPELVKSLRKAGIDVYLADPATLEDVFALTRAVAERVGASSRGEQLVSGLRAQVAKLGAAEPARRRVFVYDCCDPPFTAGGRTVLADLIARAGGQNIFADLDADWTHVSWEEVLVRRPELIVIHAYRHDGQSDVAGKKAALAQRTALAGTPTLVLPLGYSLGGIRSVEGLRRLHAAVRERS